MKITTLKNRLEKRYKGAKSRISYKVIVDIIDGSDKTYMIQMDAKAGIIIRPVYTSGAKRFLTNQDHTQAITSILDLLGVKYETGNDAPRGGLTGNYIKILTILEK